MMTWTTTTRTASPARLPTRRARLAISGASRPPVPRGGTTTSTRRRWPRTLAIHLDFQITRHILLVRALPQADPPGAQHHRPGMWRALREPEPGRKERAMTRWTIDAPTTLDFDGVAALRVRIISGSVAVLSTEERPCLDIANLAGQPLLVSHEAGILTVTYEDLTWDGLLGWLRPQRHSAAITITVPKDCPIQLGVVNASAIVSGISAKTSVRSVSGNITLDGVTGTVEAKTVSGDIEAQGIDGRIGFNSVSGDLTLADGTVHHLDAKTVSGRITADIALEHGGGLRVGTVSGPVAIRLPAQTRRS